MTLNRFIFVISAALILLSSCQKNNQFTISGKITHAEGETIYLEELLVSSRKPIAEVVIDKNGEFEFEGETGIPTYYLLKVSNKIITLLVDSVENVVVQADVANFDREYSVEGSVGSDLLKKLIVKYNTTEHKLDSLKSLEVLYRGNPDYKVLKDQWNEEYNKIVQDQVDFSTNFVLENPFSMASVYALYQKFKDDGSFIVRDLQTMRTAASALSSIYPDSKHVQALYNNTLQILQGKRAEKVQQIIEEQGQNSPEIVLPDQNGKEIALSSLRGKVVLLQFWAAEDRGSRILNPVLSDVYKKYKRKGFEIYQVSLDNNRIEWVDAIDKDKMTWINVGDMNGSVAAVNAYNVQQIPFNYLLDKEGIIIARNLKGPALGKALSQVFK